MGAACLEADRNTTKGGVAMRTVNDLRHTDNPARPTGCAGIATRRWSKGRSMISAAVRLRFWRLGIDAFGFVSLSTETI